MFLLNQWATDVFYKCLWKGGYQHFYWLSWFSIATLCSLRTETASWKAAGWPQWLSPCAQDGGEWHRIARNPLAPCNCFKILLQNLMLWIHPGSVILEVFPRPHMILLGLGAQENEFSLLTHICHTDEQGTRPEVIIVSLWEHSSPNHFFPWGLNFLGLLWRLL